MWKDGMSTEQVLRSVLRSYLIRCHRSVSENYPEVANMTPERSADFLLHLRDTGRIDIKLKNKSGNLIGCKITELPQPDEESIT
jgi:hypothetical protein